ncbi:3-oxoacyl- acyl-carrier protein reductase [Paramagnetospirillum magnetotacticum MS-1]|uniref:3-oxoacyl-acyl-carrier protein reductase n=1 Tax=Paramagnetospirillum magnetotacticum MS-1 TaxID=272627 RepID=A0A0C2YRK9_PARME|nr:SDR family oxidoreductase [Paramagnetospirillum magnetotacticum]KIL97768.1 3-oxoacyl- acyl-carrier protein reductase [Paramagnetospirillum magnetotacticum MS-1]
MTESIIPSLRHKRVLVTGAGSGIGAAIASAFGRQGALVGLHHRGEPDKVLAVAAEIEASGSRALCFKADLADPTQVTRLGREFLEAVGGIDILVNNAGGIGDYPDFLDLTEESWNQAMTVNAQAPLWLIRAVWPAMVEARSGRIINISSAAVGYGGSVNGIHYVAAKAALETMSLTLAKEGARHNILVNVVRPGLTDTGNYRKIAGYTEERYAKRTALVPLGRAGRPDEIAAMVTHLASGDGGFITGQIIAVAGGD